MRSALVMLACCLANAARADDELRQLTAQLEAKNDAKAATDRHASGHADPFAPGNRAAAVLACPSCGAHCTCTPEDGCGDRTCPAIKDDMWRVKAGTTVPVGYRWNAVEGYAYRQATAAPLVAPGFGFYYLAPGGACPPRGG